MGKTIYKQTEVGWLSKGSAEFLEDNKLLKWCEPNYGSYKFLENDCITIQSRRGKKSGHDWTSLEWPPKKISITVIIKETK